MYKDVTYTALELFDRAWSTPILHLAREIGVSDVTLSKACRKAGIELPRSGHWGKSEAKRAEKPNPPTTNETLTFRVLDRSLFPPAPAKSDSPTSKPPKLAIPSELSHPHLLVQKWLQATKVVKEVDGRLELRQSRVLNTRISRELVARSALLLNTLIKHTEQHGCRWAVNDKNRTTVTLDGETLYVMLRERVTKAVRPPPPPDPKPKRNPVREPVLWLGKREEYQYSTTGELTLIVQELPEVGSQTSWTDNKTGQLEDKLQLFILGITKLIGRIRADRASAKERYRQEEEAAKIRRRALMAAEHQHTLQKRLLENMEKWEKTLRYRKFIDAVAVGADGSNEEERRQVDTWVKWARAQVDEIDPLRDPLTTSLKSHEESI